MAHRLGNGEKIADIKEARKKWRRERRSPATFCNKGEWDAWRETFGRLVKRYADGTEIRRHGTVKGHTRGGSKKINHNVILIGKPASYAEWLADPRPQLEKGWHAQWTYYPDSWFDDIMERHDAAEAAALTPVVS